MMRTNKIHPMMIVLGILVFTCCVESFMISSHIASISSTTGSSGCGIFHKNAFTRTYTSPYNEMERFQTNLNSVSPSLVPTGPVAKAASAIGSLHSNDFYVLSAILFLSTFGIVMERRTTFGKALSVSHSSRNLFVLGTAFWKFSSLSNLCA